MSVIAYKAGVGMGVDRGDWKSFTDDSAVRFSRIDPRHANRRDAKIYKMLPHLFVPDAAISIWADIGLKVPDKERLLSLLGGADLGVLPHPQRRCVYEEAETIKQLGKDDPSLVDAQVAFLRSRGWPESAGLYCGGFLVRRHNDRTLKLGLMWWEQVCKFTSRDQVALPFCIKESGVKLAVLPIGLSDVR